MALPSPVQPPEPSTPHGQGAIAGRIVVQGGGVDRFGVSTQLAVTQQVALDLALAYAQEYGFTEAQFRGDPEVTILCTGLALARQREFLLQQQMEADLATRAEALGGDYGAAMFGAVKNDVHGRHQKDLDKMHMRAARYRAELADLAASRKAPQ